MGLDSPTAVSESAMVDVYVQSPSLPSAQHDLPFVSTDAHGSFSPTATPSPMGSRVNLDSLCSFESLTANEEMEISVKRDPHSQRSTAVREAEAEYHKRRLIKTSSSTFGCHE